MQEPNRVRKGDIKEINKVTLNEEQKLAKSLIVDNQIVVVTGQAGSGKSLVCAQAALGFLTTKQCKAIYVARAAVEVGKSLGYLPGELQDKFNPYIEGFVENLYKCYDKGKIDMLVQAGAIVGFPVQFVRGKTIDDILIVEEAQNLTKHEMIAVLTRLGKTGKIIINGDQAQMDINPTNEMNGLQFVLELAKYITSIKVSKLKENHRSGLVGEILNYIHGK